MIGNGNDRDIPDKAPAARRARSERGARAYQSGIAAEEIVARQYMRSGHEVAATRWRGTGGEIDLVLRDGAGLIFVEVKKSRSFGRAAERVSPRQLRRIFVSAEEFLAGEPRGLLTEARVDVALVDGMGRIDIVENVMAA